MTRARLLMATWFGIGSLPLVPGTFGSLAGLLLWWLLVVAGGWQAALTGFIIVTVAGFWSAGAAEARYGKKDPGHVVIDEVSGQMLALLFLPVAPAVLIGGFLLFRLLDILKPYPARRLESLEGAAGIMSDDLIAGLYANLLLQLLWRLVPLWWGRL
jgi:phosphatidylglycerophosphatase A